MESFAQMPRGNAIAKHWSRPNPKSIGDEDHTLIWQGVGEALSSWELVELSLSSLYAILCGNESYIASLAVRRSFGAIEFNSGRRKAICAAAEVYFARLWSAAKVEIDQIDSNVANASRRRDDIAHGLLTTLTAHDGFRGSFLMPPNYNTGRTYAFPKQTDISIDLWHYRFTSADLKDISSKFLKLQTWIWDYTTAIKPLLAGESPAFLLERQEVRISKGRGKKASDTEEA